MNKWILVSVACAPLVFLSSCSFYTTTEDPGYATTNVYTSTVNPIPIWYNNYLYQDYGNGWSTSDIRYSKGYNGSTNWWGKNWAGYKNR